MLLRWCPIGLVVGALGCSGNKPLSEVDFVVDGSPTAQIDSPSEGQRLYVDRSVSFVGKIDDFEDAVDTLEVWWASDVDGDLDMDLSVDVEGTVSGSGSLTLGNHGITLNVRDSGGNTDLDHVVITVGGPNEPPSCEIIHPEDESAGAPGELVTFTARVSDPDVGSDLLTIVWSSDIDGEIGTSIASSDGTTVLPSSALSIGVHAIRLFVQDEVGSGCLDQVVYGVGEGPEVEISRPSDTALFDENEAIRFTGTATDSTDASGDLDIQWRSDVDGLISDIPADDDGTMSFQYDGLSVGEHTMTLWARNSLDLVNSEEIGIIINGVPTAPEVVIHPGEPTSSDDLTAEIRSPSSDPDGVEIVYSYDWYENGLLVSEGSSGFVPASATTRGDTWRVVVTPSDGITDGSPGEASVLVGNSLPVIEETTLTPDPAKTEDDLLCSVGGVTDEDGDDTTMTYQWTINGGVVAVTTAVLDSAWTAKGWEVFCSAHASDGIGDGSSLRSNVVLIENTAPEVLTVMIDPEPVRWGDTPSCLYTGFSDADGDADHSTIEWRVNGSIVGTDVTAPPEHVYEDILNCTVIPSDGEETGEIASYEVVVANSAPTFESISMVPEVAYAGDSIHCTHFGYHDWDGHDDASFVMWTLDGGLWSVGSEIGPGTVGGDTVTCTIVAYDGLDEGTALSLSQTIANTPPSIESVNITPSDPDSDSVLTCETIGFTDLDGDEDLSLYQWMVNVSVIATTSSTLSGVFSSDDWVTCMVTAFDGHQEGNTAMDMVIIGDAPPEILSLVFSEPVVYTDTYLRAVATGTDSDGDEVTITYQWRVNGSVVGVTGSILSGHTWFDRWDWVDVTVTPWAGSLSGDSVGLGPIEVQNRPPSSPLVSIVPEDPVDGEASLQCVIDAPSLDVDGDAVVYTIEWTVDDAVFTETTTTDEPGDTVPFGVAGGGEEWNCTITPFDEFAPGVPGTATVIVESTLGRSEDNPAVSCREIIDEWSEATNGVYWIDPLDEDDPLPLWCDMTTDDGGWTLVIYAPRAGSPPIEFETPYTYHPIGCSDGSDFCRLSDDLINGILSYGTGSDDRLRLLAPGLPIQNRFYWDTTSAFDSFMTNPDSVWFKAAYSYGGDHSLGCRPSDARGVGHDPAADGCVDDPDFDPVTSNRVFLLKLDGSATGSDSSSSFAWYVH